MTPQETAPAFDPAATLAAVREHRAAAKRVKMDTSSVRRYLQKLPELAQPTEPTGAESD